ncbi:MAG: hypothetical protein AAF842_11885 [Planctomycetota bacterium]
MTPPTSEHIDPSLIAEPIADDVFCWQCGYSLRTRTADDDCPECGFPIAKTLAEQRLMFGRANTTAEFVSALRLLAVSLFLTAFSFPGTVFLGVISVSGGEGVFGLLWFVVAIEYALWMAGCLTVARLFHDRPLRVLGILTAATAVLTSTLFAVGIFGFDGFDSEVLLGLLVLAVAATQAVRIAGIVRLWPHVFGVFRQFHLKGQATALKFAAGAGILTTAALGLSHLLMTPMLLGSWGSRGEAFVIVAIVAAIGCYVAAFWTAITLLVNAAAVHRAIQKRLRAD